MSRRTIPVALTGTRHTEGKDEAENRSLGVESTRGAVAMAVMAAMAAVAEAEAVAVAAGGRPVEGESGKRH